MNLTKNLRETMRDSYKILQALARFLAGKCGNSCIFQAKNRFGFGVSNLLGINKKNQKNLEFFFIVPVKSYKKSCMKSRKKMQDSLKLFSEGS